jgi:hypothetical protein
MTFLMTLALALNSFTATISVKIYGPACNGLADNTAATQKASDIFPQGSHCCFRRVTVAVTQSLTASLQR